MKSFGLLAACFTAVQAWQVLLYPNTGCQGTGYFTENVDGCKQPDDMPADFDAKSVQIINVPVGKRINIFTDQNSKCDKLAAANTWAFYISVGGTECQDLTSTKNGKWRIIQVEDYAD